MFVSLSVVSVETIHPRYIVDWRKSEKSNPNLSVHPLSRRRHYPEWLLFHYCIVTICIIALTTPMSIAAPKNRANIFQSIASLWRRVVYSKHKLSFAPLSRRASYPVLFTLHDFWRRAEDLHPKLLHSIRFRGGRISFNASLSKWRKREDLNPMVLPTIRLATDSATLHWSSSIHCQNLRRR